VIGLIATLAAVAVIAILMVVGWRMKLPPPDPDWRDHLPPSPPSRPRWYVVLWMARFPLLLLVAIAALMHADRLAVWLSLVFVGATIVLVVLRVIQARQQMRHRGA